MNIVAKFEIEGISPLSFNKRHEPHVKASKEPYDTFEERIWTQRLHIWEEDDKHKGEVVIPPDAISKSIIFTAKFLSIKLEGNKTYTKRLSCGSMIRDPLFLGVKLRGVKKEASPVPLNTTDVKKEYIYVPSDGKPGTASKVLKIFPYLPKWGGTFEVHVFDEAITADILRLHVEKAGVFSGLGRYRPSSPATPGYYGRFVVKNMWWDGKKVDLSKPLPFELAGADQLVQDENPTKKKAKKVGRKK